jgi:hypothetical protein
VRAISAECRNLRADRGRRRATSLTRSFPAPALRLPREPHRLPCRSDRRRLNVQSADGSTPRMDGRGCHPSHSGGSHARPRVTSGSVPVSTTCNAEIRRHCGDPDPPRIHAGWRWGYTSTRRSRRSDRQRASATIRTPARRSIPAGRVFPRKWCSGRTLTPADAAAAVPGAQITIAMAGRAIASLIGAQCGTSRAGRYPGAREEPSSR